MPDEFNQFRWHELAMRLTRGMTSRVAGVMFDRAGADGTKVYVNNEKLAGDLGCSEKSVRRARKELELLGLARLERRGHNRNGSALSSEYALTMPSQPDISGVSQPDKSTGHLGVNRTSVSSQPDILGQSTGHQCPTNRSVTRPGNRTGSVKSQPDIEMSGGVNRTSTLPMSGGAAPLADAAIEGSDPKESEPSDGGSSSMATGTPPGVLHQPDTSVSGATNSEPATGGAPVRDRNDPWHDPDEDHLVAQYEAHLASTRETAAQTFRMPANAFIGPPTDPATGGPDWDAGPQQVPVDR